ncbi:hypothetical protein B0I35DRAFT_478720 [Stachybotrys elegans]|uniref:C2H2-type domain-containing protein n=1 Tax=Stachybotrys elegans TaxID=80388 RepID=A0A8K0SR90_9HYPO|nr:hypothetical protein B0I35DRAFT_478720 [Stachybotrys elegans]
MENNPSAMNGESCGQWLCKPCYVLFGSREALIEHQLQMRKAGEAGHICCKVCGQGFVHEKLELAHMLEVHSKEQGLDCPGCTKGPYPRLGNLLHHIETGECTSLSLSELERMRIKKLDFVRKLRALTNDTVKSDYSAYVDPYHKFNAEGRGVQQGVGSLAAENVPLHPEHPNFRSAHYYNPYSEKYSCPMIACNKTFAKPKGLVSHLLSPVHGTKVYRCPYCNSEFKSLQSIASHAESAGVRCKLRGTDQFGAFIDQLTAGLIDVLKERHDDGTPKFKTNDQARDKIASFRANEVAENSNAQA